MSYGVKKERAGLDSDFDVLSSQLIGMEFENNGKGTLYHTPNDTVAGVDPSLVQSQGESMLLLARHFGSLDLGTAYQGDRLYLLHLANFWDRGIPILGQPAG
jgi:hypothetical protein